MVLDYIQERIDLTAAFRWAVVEGLHEGVANHFSLSVSDDGKKFLMNPDKKHFSRVTASNLLLLDADDKTTMQQPNAPDETAWGLHGSIHRLCPHAKCLMHAHSPYATALACLEDAILPPLEQNAAMFYQRQVVDKGFGGMAFEDEGERCATLLSDPKIKIMIMGNHGILAIGKTVSEAFEALYIFERACKVYLLALQTSKKLNMLSHDIAQKTADEIANYEKPYSGFAFLEEIKAMLDKEQPDYKN